MVLHYKDSILLNICKSYGVTKIVYYLIHVKAMVLHYKDSTLLNTRKSYGVTLQR